MKRIIVAIAVVIAILSGGAAQAASHHYVSPVGAEILDAHGFAWTKCADGYWYRYTSWKGQIDGWMRAESWGQIQGPVLRINHTLTHGLHRCSDILSMRYTLGNGVEEHHKLPEAFVVSLVNDVN